MCLKLDCCRTHFERILRALKVHFMSPWRLFLSILESPQLLWMRERGGGACIQMRIQIGIQSKIYVWISIHPSCALCSEKAQWMTQKLSTCPLSSGHVAHIIPFWKRENNVGNPTTKCPKFIKCLSSSLPCWWLKWWATLVLNESPIDHPHRHYWCTSQ